MVRLAFALIVLAACSPLRPARPHTSPPTVAVVVCPTVLPGDLSGALIAAFERAGRPVLTSPIALPPRWCEPGFDPLPPPAIEGARFGVFGRVQHAGDGLAVYSFLILDLQRRSELGPYILSAPRFLFSTSADDFAAHRVVQITAAFLDG